MATIDPVASALDTLAAYLETQLAGAVSSVARGWPEHGKELDMSSGPVGVVTAAKPVRTPCSPRRVDFDAGVVTYKVGGLAFPLQLDFFAEYRAQIDDLVPLVEAALHNMLPATSGLWLDQGSYYGRPLALTKTSGPERFDGAARVVAGDWRAMWMLDCDTDEVVTKSTPAADEIDTTYDFDEYGSTVRETYTVTP